ncbi:MAG: hypothetical protein ACXADW_13550 [Candidatus Hodarchaeales archaeon]|jgi:hypothetical protein
MAKGKVQCQICEQYVNKFQVKKLYGSIGARWKKEYYGCACKSCFNKLLNRQREKHGINFFSDDIRDLDINTPLG